MAERLSISDSFELYRLDFISFKNQSKKTEENHNICGRSLISFCGDIMIEDLDFQTIREWKQHLERERSPATVRNYVIKLRVVLAFCYKRGLKVVDPDTVPVPKRVQTVPTWLTHDEVAQMIDAARELRTKLVISLLYSSGIRLSELISLNRNDIRDSRFTVVGKGGKARLCFIDQRTETLLNKYLKTRTDKNAVLIYSRIGTRMKATNIQVMIRDVAEKARIDRKVTPHTLRHSYATNFLKNNGNMRYLSTMLGHSSLDTTAMYAHVVDNDLEAQYRLYHST